MFRIPPTKEIGSMDTWEANNTPSTSLSFHRSHLLSVLMTDWIILPIFASISFSTRDYINFILNLHCSSEALRSLSS